MGSNAASTGGGGGGVGPAGVKVTKTGEKKYGTAQDARKVSNRNVFRTFVKEGGVVGALLKGVTGKTAYERNLERRKAFIKKQGLTSDDIKMDDAYLSSKEGLAELKKQGYTTVSDVTPSEGGGNQVVQAPIETMATATAPTTAEVSQSAATDADAKEEDILYRKRKTKRTGRSMLVVTSPQGDTSGLTLGKKSLLGS